MPVFLMAPAGLLPRALGVGFVMALIYSITSGIDAGFTALNVWGMVPTTLFFAAAVWAVFLLRWFPWGWLLGHLATWFRPMSWAVPGFHVLMSLVDFSRLALSKQLSTISTSQRPQA